jgi:VWFA-related protein
VKVSLCVAVVLATAVAAAQEPRPQSQRPPVFRANVDAVRIDVQTTSDGKPIAGLTPDDFEVRDNGVLQTVDLATTAGSLSVVIALDVQGNDEWPMANIELIHASQALASALKPVDHAWLLTFAEVFNLQVGPTSNGAQIYRLLNQAVPGRGKTLWDTLFASVSLVAGLDGRAMVMVVSDGQEGARRTGWLDEPRAIELLKRGDVMVSAVQPRTVVVSPTALERAARATGGVVFEAARNPQLAQQFTKLLDECRLGYVLTFTPTGVRKDDGWHNLTVRLKNRSGQTRARDGYFAGMR